MIDYPNFKNGKRRFRNLFVLLFIILSLLAITAAVMYNNSRKQTVVKETYKNLASVSHLKTKQIIEWRKDLLADAEVIEYNKLIIDDLNDFISGRSSGKQQNENVLFWLQKKVKVYNYLSAVLIDPKGKPVLWTEDFNGNIDTISREIINEGLKTKDEYLSDLYVVEKKPMMVLVAPLWNDPGDRSKTVGSVVFFIDPAVYLFPFIQSWPYPSETAENFIVRKEDSSVLFLSELRFREHAPLNFSIPLSDSTIPGVIAVKSNGTDTLIDAFDYRGKEVFAFSQKIPGLPWFIISKIDKEEIYQSFKQQSLFTGLFVASFILLIGFFFLLLRKSFQANLYRHNYESKLESEAMLKHFELLTKNANDNIFLVNENEKIIFVNEKVLQTYLYEKDELIGMHAKMLRSPEAQQDFENLKLKLKNEDGIIYETVHMKKDGSLFPIEASTRGFIKDGKKFYQSIVRDITERKRIDEVLRQSDNLINERARDIERLYEAGVKFNSTLDLSVIYENIFNVVKNAMECYVFAISSFDKKNNLIRYEYVINDGVKLDAGFIPPIPLNPSLGGIQSKVIKSGKPALFSDYRAELNNCKKIIYVEGENISDEAKEDSMLPETAIMVPVILNDEVIGLLQVFSYKKGVYTDNNLKFLGALSPQIAAATANAQLYEKAKTEIEERKKIEEALELTHFSIDSASDAITWINSDGKFIEVNEAACKLFGVSKKDFVNFKVQDFDLTHNGEEWDRLWNNVRENKSLLFETVIKKNNNKIIPVEVLANYINFKGSEYLVVFGRDITERKENEKKINFQANLLDVVANSVMATDLEGNIFYWNRFSEKMYGWKKEEVLDRNVNDVMFGGNETEYVMKILELMKKGEKWEGERGVYRKDGSSFIKYVIDSPIFDNNRNVTGIVEVSMDITERKKAEEALNKSQAEIKERVLDVEKLYAAGVMLSSSLELPVVYENTFRLIKNTMRCDDFILSSYNDENEMITCKYIYHNSIFTDVSTVPPIPLNKDGSGIQSNVIMSGKSRLVPDYRAELERCRKVIYISKSGEFSDTKQIEFVVPESGIFVPIIFNKKVIGVIQVLSFEKGVYTENHLKFLEALSPQIAAATGNAVLYEQAKVEIEERKKAEEALHLTHFSVDKASDAIVWITETGEFTEVNGAACKLFGVPKEMFSKIRIQDFDFINSKEEWKWFWNHVKENSPVLREDEITLKYGTKITVEILANYIEFKGKEFLVVFGRDITSRTKAEEQVRFQSSLLDIVEHTVIAADSMGKITYWNKFAENIHGWKAEEVMGKNIGQLLLDSQCIDQSKKIQYSTENGLSWQGEIISLRKDGSSFPAYLTNTPILDANGKLAGTVGAAVDITNRKRAEKALIESEKHHRELFEFANDAILVIAPESEEIFDANNKACEMYGVAKHELIGMSMKSFTLDVQKGETNNRKLKTLGSVRNIESVHLSKKGTRLDILYNASIIDYNGKPAILSINRDITEIKKQEEIIKEASEQLRLLYETSERLNKSLNLNETYETIHDFINGIMDCDGLCLSSYNPVDKMATCLAGWNGKKRIDVGGFPKLELEDEGHGTQSRVIRSGKSLIINDYGQYEHTSKKVYYVDNEGFISEGLPKGNIVTKSALLVPLKIDNEVIGVLQVFSYQKNAYSESNKQLLESIALHVSSSVNNARLYEKAQCEIAERKKAELELVVNKERYLNLFESANDAILVLDPANECVLDVNHSACELYGIGKEDFIGKCMTELSINPELGAQKINELFKEGKVENCKTRQRKADGTVMDIIYNASLINYNGKKAILTVNRDDTARKRTEERLIKLSTAVQQSPESIIITNLDGEIEYVNRGFVNMTGYKEDEVIGKNPRMLQSGFTPVDIYKGMWNSIKNGQVWYGEILNKKKNGDLYWQSVSISPIKNEDSKITHYISIQENITEKKAKDEKLRNSLKEKETVLKEIHHRVKNNLQIISSLLKLQSQFITDEEDKLIFDESQRRIKAMSLIHQNLYSSDTLSSIDFGDYVRKLVRDLFSSFNVQGGKINYQINVDDIFFDIETSIPCGLLINELVSNSLKYAFDDQADSVITIELIKVSGSVYNLIVSDNGKGIPENIDFRNTNSLGLQLVSSLTEQLEGTISLDKTNGTKFSIEFENNRYTKRI